MSLKNFGHQSFIEVTIKEKLKNNKKNPRHLKISGLATMFKDFFELF
jgi:hypothetical protein